MYYYRLALAALRGSGAEMDLAIAEANTAQVLAKTGFVCQALDRLKHSLKATQQRRIAQVAGTSLPGWGHFLLVIGRYDLAQRVCNYGARIAAKSQLWQPILELHTLEACGLFGMGQKDQARMLLSRAIDTYATRSPFETLLSAKITLASVEHGLGTAVERVEEMLRPLLETARKKRMRWHLAQALMLRGEALIAANRAEEAEAPLAEAADIATGNADRTVFWNATYLLGRAFEQMLRFERALACYRVSALTIHELAMNIEQERYKSSFLAIPRVREVNERYARMKGEVGKRARYDLAAMSRNEKISRRMLGALSAIGRKLTSILDLDELMESVLDLAIEKVQAERGIIFRRNESTGDMVPECARGMDKESLDEVSSFSNSVIRQVAEGRALLTVDVGQDPSLSAYKSLVLHEIKSILCVPMRARGRVIGVIYLDTRRAAQLFTERERAFVESFASQAAIAIENARLFGDVKAENVRLQREVEGRSRFENLIGVSPAMKKLTETIAGVFESDCNVLVLGESGTGKELVARAIHYNGRRQKKKFVAIDCGALPETLLEAELFGYARGAFTGADRDRIGLIEEARGGTLFLDEITNTSFAFQARLLRVIQEHELRRLGENAPRQIDVRVVAATNSDINRLMTENRFRRDLYFRLNVVTVQVPPLRDRREDIPLLVDHFLKAQARDGRPSKRLGPGVLEILSGRDWPGNVRELANCVERLTVLSPGAVIAMEDLPEGVRPVGAGEGPNGNGNGHKSGERLMIEDALRRYAGDKAKAARFIGWNRQKLYRRLRLLGIPADYGRPV
ncbi:MAG TPA: sigma 54-interacting transcriptional regulator [Candidatus Polarisedimenticolia bacterium]|nr:sigma 54-interacting transcriptional regulator [Candidatus Polarisedimenticolia bacterium]